MQERMRVAFYESDMTDEEWLIVQEFLPGPAKTGRPRAYHMRDVIDAIFYVTKTGCQWRMLPADFPPFPVVFYHFKRLERQEIWQQMLTSLGRRVRAQAGREEDPTLLLIDSQSAPTQHASQETKGFDAHKKVNGRKRHMITDTLGILVAVFLSVATMMDAHAAPKAIEKAKETGRVAHVTCILADQAYQKEQFPQRAQDILGHEVEVSTTKPDGKGPGFHVAPKRWVVERSNAWTLMARRNGRDYERTVESATSMVEIAHVRLLLHRLAG